jgi:uncharacterized protein YeaO (DUF488 family)
MIEVPGEWLQVKRIYEEREPDDGLCVLVDRLWPRGVRRAAVPEGCWEKELAPSAALRKAYHSGVLSYEQFAEQYRAELDQSPAAEAFIGRCRALRSDGGHLTLLYAAKNEKQNHALVLRGWIDEKTKN